MLRTWRLEWNQERAILPNGNAILMTDQSTLAQRSRAIELLVLDVDGVLTDGGIIFGSGGLEQKVFHVRDGSGLKFWHSAGKRSAIISGRTSDVVRRRAKETGITHVFEGVDDKAAILQSLLEKESLAPEKACFVGDDLPDLPVLTRVGLAVAVADACPEVRRHAHYVTQAGGGRGAVREVVELILGTQGLWDRVVAGYRGQPGMIGQHP
jgi:3-deoxy-D-manno-octulosonate 8-phosphate phosphatase (KDO 8-P phosphatase)